MMRVVFSLLIIISTGLNLWAQSKWTGNTSPDYYRLIDELKRMDKESPLVSLYNMGPSDVPGLPIYVCVLNGTGDSSTTFLKARKGTTLLFNNAIHPGEPDGINACLIYTENYTRTMSVVC
ncbi:MAG: hypothetical protein RLZZ382_1390 [Bacteroidota bacterium]